MMLERLCKVSLSAVAVFALAATSSSDSKRPGGQFTSRDFAELMQTVAARWNEGNARKAADCFTEDAIYSSPPSPQMHKGNPALYQFFGGPKGRGARIFMGWHHLVFDEQTQIGFGEYTFRYGKYQAHGVVVIRIRESKIQNWRAYEVSSRLDWDHFVGENSF
ncbi:MAG: nuclear transport factor 2 family protein [Candidatus Acidiferrales bacterium]